MVNAYTAIQSPATTHIRDQVCDLLPPTYEAALKGTCEESRQDLPYDEAYEAALEFERSQLKVWTRHNPMTCLQPVGREATARIANSSMIYDTWIIGRWFAGSIDHIIEEQRPWRHACITSPLSQPWCSTHLRTPMSSPNIHQDFRMRKGECAYFEVTIVHLDHCDYWDESGSRYPRSAVSIGTCVRPHALYRPPGWAPYSAGLFSTGELYHNEKLSTSGQKPGLYFGRELRIGDVVGCGVTWNGQVFHILIGEDGYSRSVFHPCYDVTDGICEIDVYPAIAVQGRAQVTVNFGHEPFRYSCVCPSVERETWWKGTIDISTRRPTVK